MAMRQSHVRFNTGSTRFGYTLTELLIVIMIALLLMVVSLPTIKTVMEDGRPREASRILNTVIFTAKSRAALTGSPSGIDLVYQQMNDTSASVAAYQCTQIYMCEMPPIYAGDTTDARVSVNTSLSPWEFTFGTNAATNLPSLLDSTNQFWIRINHRGPWYSVSYSNSKYTLNQSTSVLPPTADTNGYSFQIRRPPVRVGNPIELPKSTAIDLTYSGFGPTGDEFASTEKGGDFLRILFSPTGNVESFAKKYPPAMQGQSWTMQTRAATGTIHFLVGLTNKINPPVDTSVSTTANIFDVERSNLADGNALWVSIGRTTGIVTTNENAAAPPTSSMNASTPMDRTNYLQTCRTYATNREQKGGR
jgi:type II secretory pathway pseudopilin PulG